MGNCGFTLAPCRESEKHLVMRNLERAEDISPEAMEAGIRWSWEDFPQYLDAVDRLPKGINYAAYIGHSALRSYVMGERAFSQQSNAAELAAMKREVRKAISAGAIGFTTSRSFSHQTPQGLPVASRLATWDEVRQLVGVLGELGAGVFELASEDMRDPSRVADYMGRLKQLALDTSVPITLGVFSAKGLAPNYWKSVLGTIDETVAAGGWMFGQTLSRSLNVLFSFQTVTPFDRLPVWSEIRKLPLAEQEAALRNPELRPRLIEAVRAHRPDADGGCGGSRRQLQAHLCAGQAAAAVPVDFRNCRRAQTGSRRSDHRDGARAPSKTVLPANARQRGSGRSAGDDSASPHHSDLFGLGRACIADHGFLPANPSAELLGAREAGADVGGRSAPYNVASRFMLGTGRAWINPRRLRGRFDRVRSGSDRPADAGAGLRFAGRRPAPEAKGRRLAGYGRQWPGVAAQQRAYRRTTGPVAARPPGALTCRAPRDRADVQRPDLQPGRGKIRLFHRRRDLPPGPQDFVKRRFTCL